MGKHNYYYRNFTDDIVNSREQNYQLPDDYQIFPKKIGKLWQKLIRQIARLIGCIYGTVALHVRVVGKDKLRQVKNQGYFVYGNHTQALGDAVDPFRIFPLKNFYLIASQANWGIPVLGKFALPYAGLPIGQNVQQAIKLIRSVETVIKQNGIVVIYPEAHVWPFYTKLRPFDATSMNFPVSLNAPSFTMTTTYHRPKFGKRPRTIIYIDGPFYPAANLSKKQAQRQLHEQIQGTLKRRTELSDYDYYNYQKLD